jgi:tRNA G10  N-methylase Trm11
MGGRKTRPYDTAYELHEWDATRVPLPDASVDALTADLPFGHRVGSHGDNVTLHPAILKEAARVARPGARFVVITAEVKLAESALTSTVSHWEWKRMLRVNLGGLKPGIFVLRRKE